VSGSGISWAMCKSALRSRQTTTPAPHHLQAGCRSCRPTNSVKALKAKSVALAINSEVEFLLLLSTYYCYVYLLHASTKTCTSKVQWSSAFCRPAICFHTHIENAAISTYGTATLLFLFWQHHKDVRLSYF